MAGPHCFLRHLELRLRYPLRTNSRSSPTSTRRSSTPRTSIRSPSSTSPDDVCIIPPNSFALARTVEYFRIPRSVLTVCLGKSTYARCGIIVNVTPFEPEWEGHVTLEFSNTTPLPAKIYANEGCRAGAVLRVRRGMRNLLQGSRRQVPGPGRRHPAEDLTIRAPTCIQGPSDGPCFFKIQFR
jgi:deoxycytidine triphosphate deaminase